MEDHMTTALGVGLSNAQLKNLKTTTQLRSDLGAVGPQPAPNPTPTPRQPGLHGPPGLSGGKPSPDPSPTPKQPAPKGRFPARRNGQNMPQAQDVIGVDIVGSVAVTATCDECGGKHRLFECPKKFARENPGKTMPSFDANGASVPAAWVGYKFSPSTNYQWLRMQ
jgi:hypothetical protein